MIDPTQKATALGDVRTEFLRLLHEDDAAALAGAMAFHQADLDAWFERVCRHYGATDGTWATVPEAKHADALRFMGRKIADYENRCQFELELLKIERDEDAEAAFDEALEG